ncbi:hypothetical protein ACP4OV_016412 [Aristida adscensionis]
MADEKETTKAAAAAAEEEEEAGAAAERKAKRKRLLEEMLGVTRLAMEARGDDEQVRARLAEAAETLARRAEALDGQDAAAWAAAHPPRRIPAAALARHARLAALDVDAALLPSAASASEEAAAAAAGLAGGFPAIGGDAGRLLEEIREETARDEALARKHMQELKAMAAARVREHEAQGYVEDITFADYGLPPDFLNLLVGQGTPPPASN